MLDKPLFVVDMTLYEFVHILGLINKIIADFELDERKTELKKLIGDMFGRIPIEEGSRPRSLGSSKKKMVQNFMITINQLQLLENPTQFYIIYNNFNLNTEKFYEDLKEYLLNKGKWIDYIYAIKKINLIGNFNNKKEYVKKVATDLNKNYTDITINAFIKQYSYVSRWLKNKLLNVIGYFTPESGVEILYEIN